jgi:methionyl-tRNA formyltransferase
LNYIFCGYRKWSLELFNLINKKYNGFHLVKTPKQLTYKKIKKLNPKFIFFPDWSWKVPEEIFQNYNCICFHEANLPKFRGGSPLQNQIIRGIEKTKTTAFLMNDKLDAGDIIMKKNLSLKGNISDIFERMKKNDLEILDEIISGNFKLHKQKGPSSIYKRRKPSDSELDSLNYSKKYIYNFIRMLDDPYPNAFIRIGKHKIVFKNAKLEKNKLRFEAYLE